MLDELNGMFDLEFPRQLESCCNSAFDSVKYKPGEWLEKHSNNENKMKNIDWFVNVPRRMNDTYRIRTGLEAAV